MIWFGRYEQGCNMINVRKCIDSLGFAVAMLCSGAVSGNDVADCRTADVLLGADSSEVAAACHRLAEQGDARAQFVLGVMYDFGEGVPQDYAEAMRWFRKAADQHLAAAQFGIGSMYDNGQGVPQDYAEAAKWYRKAADQEDANGQYYL